MLIILIGYANFYTIFTKTVENSNTSLIRGLTRVVRGKTKEWKINNVAGEISGHMLVSRYIKTKNSNF